MASTIGGSWSFGGRRPWERRPAVGTVEQAEHPGAAKRARVSAGSSRSGVSSSGKDGVLRTIFRSVLTNHLMGASRDYVRLELLTEAARLEIVLEVVEKISCHHREVIPETEKLMEQYISQNGEKIKKCLKQYVEQFWQDSRR